MTAQDRRQEMRRELATQFSRGLFAPDAAMEYQKALDEGDSERASAIAEVAPTFLRGVSKVAFARLVNRNTTSAMPKAEKPQGTGIGAGLRIDGQPLGGHNQPTDEATSSIDRAIAGRGERGISYPPWSPESAKK